MASKLRQMSKKRKFVADGVFYAELNELLIQELGEDGYAGVDLRVTPVKTEIVIRATRTQNVLGEKGQRIRELTSIVQKRYVFESFDLCDDVVFFIIEEFCRSSREIRYLSMFRKGASSKDSEAAATHCGFCDALLLGDAEHYFYVFSFCSLYFYSHALAKQIRISSQGCRALRRACAFPWSLCSGSDGVSSVRILFVRCLFTPNLVLLLPSAMKISLISVNPLSFEH